jgi:outer membrane receptor protein involved in Fe transport
VPGPGGLPLVVTALGNPAVETERFLDAEAGYRLEIAAAASLDVTGFVGGYDHLVTHEVAAPVVSFVPSPRVQVTSQVGNQLDATTHGLEVAGHWAPVQAWRFDGSITSFHVTPQLAATSRDATAGTTDGSAPQMQWQLRAAWSPGARASLDLALFRVGAVEQLQVDAYTRADVSAEWRFTRHLSATAIGQNLFDAAHAEFAGTGGLVLATQVPRSGGVRLRWTW